MFRFTVSFLTAAVLFAAGSVACHAADGDIPTPPKHIIVKFRPALAQAVEAALPPTLQLSDPAQHVRPDFFNKFRAQSLRPLYPERVREKKRGNATDAQLADAVKRKFPARSQRATGRSAAPDLSRTYVLEFPNLTDEEIEATVRELSQHGEVEFAEREQLYRTQYTPNDTYFGTSGTWGQAYQDLWGLHRIGAPAAWDVTIANSVLVAVVDTGVDYNHPDMVNNLWTNSGEIPGNGIDDDGNGFIDDVLGWDFIGTYYATPSQDNNPTDIAGHGTHVAETIAGTGDNGLGVVGVAWGARIMAVRGLDNYGYGIDSSLANAIVYAVDNGADVINASWGGGASQTIKSAVDYAVGHGVMFVAAAGNNNANAANFFPASYASAIGVMAVDANDARATFSNFGDRMDVCAPGVDILSARATNSNLGPLVGTDYTRLSGTSMAAPHAAGVAALVLSLHPEFSVEQVRQVLRVSAKDLGTLGADSSFGYGRVNASNALTIASALEARILSPESELVTSDLVSLTGVAQGPNFNQFILDYGSGDSPSAWTILNQSSVATAGPLGDFDARNLPDGRYTVRLRVFDSQARQYEDRMKLIVNLVSISSPAPPATRGLAYEFKPGVTVPIVGTATSASFQNYQLQWARGYYATSGWSGANITLTGNGAQRTTNAVLGAWNTAGITNGDFYTIRLTVQSAGFSVTEPTVVYLEPDLLSTNWPKRLTVGADLDNSLVPQTDAAGDTWFRVLGVDYSVSPIITRLWGFPADGSVTLTQSVSAASYRQPPAGPFDGVLGDELIVAHQSNYRAFQTDNSSYAFPYPSIPWSQRSIQVMEDVHGDGTKELIFVSVYQGNGYLYVWKTNGTALTANYPVSFPEANSDIQYFGQNRVLVVDLDRDGKKEILAVAAETGGFSVRAYNWDGTVRSWPTQIQLGRFSHWAAADFDRDGLPEIVLSYIDFTDNKAKIAVFDGTGALRPGWPVALPPPADSEKGFLAIGDLDRNGVDEIVITAENVLHVLKSDGTSFGAGWPLTVGYYGQPILADINNDGYPDIITVTDDGSHNPILRAYDRNATLLKSWPLLGFEGVGAYYRATPMAGDFNRDGRTDLAVLCPLLFPNGLLNGNGLAVFSTPATFTPDATPWPMNMHDPQNLSVRLLPPEQVPPVVGISSPAANAVVSNTVSISASATDNIRVAGVKFFVDGALIGDEDTTAPFSIAWDTTTVAIGQHSLTTVARDPAGNSSTSAPVVVKVRNKIKINFQPAAAPVPAGYLVDEGLEFGPRGNLYSYGWNSNNTANVFDRNSALSADQRYDTLATMQVGGSFKWEIALPAGKYAVYIVAGDPDNYNSIYKLSAETTQVVNGTPKSTQRWLQGTKTVTLSDGRLTVSNTTGASNNKICFIEITPVP